MYPHLRNVFLNGITLKIKAEIPVSMIHILVFHFVQAEQFLSILAPFQFLLWQCIINHSVFTNYSVLNQLCTSRSRVIDSLHFIYIA